MTAPHANVQRHGQAVLGRHPRHLEQHVPPQGHRLGWQSRAALRSLVDPIGLGCLQRLGPRVRVGVVRGPGAVLDEIETPALHRGDPAGISAGVDARDLTQVGHGLGPAGLGRLEVAIGAEGRYDPPRPRRVRYQRGVRRKVVARIVRRGEHGYLEAREQRPRLVGVLGQPVGEVVVDGVGRGGRGSNDHAEDLGELGLQPVPHRGRAEDVPVRAEQTPGLTRRSLGERALPDAESFQRYPGGAQQPRHVVVRRHEQLRRIPERHIVQEHPRVGVAVRGDDREIPYCGIQPGGYPAHRGVSGQQPVRVQGERKRLALHVFHVIPFMSPCRAARG